MGTIVRFSGVTKSFKDVRAVDSLSLEIGERERVALLGPNGAGKTTSLFMLLGVVSPDAGTIELLGHPLPGERTQAMEQVGFAAGYMPLAERLKVREFLWIYARLAGIADADQRIGAALERFKIAHLTESMSHELSSGQRTLVGIVKATLHNPRLLVLDEPTASLDPEVAARVRAGLDSYCDENGAALLVTSHNMLEVERLAERVIFLAKGRVVADGAPTDIAARFQRDDLEGVFLHLAHDGEIEEAEVGDAV
jgi:ABC-2 type transport system ATP-binding protein